MSASNSLVAIREFGDTDVRAWSREIVLFHRRSQGLVVLPTTSIECWTLMSPRQASLAIVVLWRALSVRRRENDNTFDQETTVTDIMLQSTSSSLQAASPSGHAPSSGVTKQLTSRMASNAQVVHKDVLSTYHRDLFSHQPRIPARARTPQVEHMQCYDLRQDDSSAAATDTGTSPPKSVCIAMNCLIDHAVIPHPPPPTTE